MRSVPDPFSAGVGLACETTWCSLVPSPLSRTRREGVWPNGVSAKPGLWTLDWTHGLDCGLRFGLDFGLMRRAMTTISKRLWKEGTVLQLQARLVVTSSLVRTFPGPSGYEVKSQGASLEATCKHVEVAKSVGWHLLTEVGVDLVSKPDRSHRSV